MAKKTTGRKCVRYVRLGITPELDEVMGDYMRNMSPHEIRLVLFEALSAYRVAREPDWKARGSTSVFAPNVRLDVVPGQSHWQDYWAADHVLSVAASRAEHTEAAT